MNAGGFQLPLHRSGVPEEVPAGGGDLLAGTLRIPCASLLVRLVPAPYSANGARVLSAAGWLEWLPCCARGWGGRKEEQEQGACQASEGGEWVWADVRVGKRHRCHPLRWSQALVFAGARGRGAHDAARLTVSRGVGRAPGALHLPLKAL